MNRIRSWRPWTLSVLIALVVGASTFAVTPISAQASARLMANLCYSDGCNYLDPVQQGCTGTSIDEFTVPTNGKYGYRMQLIYSSNCNTAWAKITAGSWGLPDGSSPHYVAVGVFYTSSATSSIQAASKALNGLGVGQSTWSPMFQFTPWYVRACGAHVAWATDSSDPCTNAH